MILPFKTLIMESMKQNYNDTPIDEEIKPAIRENLQTKYSDPGLEDLLQKCTALALRFKTLSSPVPGGLSDENLCRSPHLRKSQPSRYVHIYFILTLIFSLMSAKLITVVAMFTDLSC